MQAECTHATQQNHEQTEANPTTLTGWTTSLQADDLITKIQSGETTIGFLLSFHSIRWLFAEHFHLNTRLSVGAQCLRIRTCIDERIKATLN